MKKYFPIFFTLVLFSFFLIPKAQAQTPDYSMRYENGVYISADGKTTSPLIGDFINKILDRIGNDADKGVTSPSSTFYGVDTSSYRAPPQLYAAENCSWSDTACIARNNAAHDANIILMSNYRNTYNNDICVSNNSRNPASMSRSCSTMFPVNTNYPKLTIPMQPAVCPVGTGQCYTPILGDKPYSGATSGSGIPSGGSTGTRTNYSGSGSTLPGSSSGQSAGGAGSVSAYVNSLMNIVRSMIATSKSAITSTSGQVTPGAVTNPVAPVSAVVSNSRIQDIISQANVLLYSSLSASEQTALTNYLVINRSALLDQNFQTFAPGSVFAWALSMGTSTTLNDLAKSLGFTNLNPTNPDPAMWRFVKTPSTATSTPVSIPANANICCSFTGWYACGGSIPNNPSPVLTPYYINGVSTLGTRKCGVQTATATINTVSFPATIITTTDLLNVRSAPNTQSIPLRQLAKGETFSVSNITDGEVVSGNGKWWVTLVGSAPAYIWSGGAINTTSVLTPTQPTITRLTPSSGRIGTDVTITGTGFLPTANTIKFGGHDFPYNSSNNGTTLTFTIPSYILPPICDLTRNMPCPQSQPTPVFPGPADITVTNANGTSNEVEFTVTQ